MSKKTDRLLLVMNILSWIVFIGLMVKAGVILISYGVSIGNPEGAKNLYNGLNLYNLRKFDFWYYTQEVSLLAALPILEAYIAYLMIRVLSTIKMSNPFTMEVSELLERISYFILLTWVAAMLYNRHTAWLAKKIQGLQENPISGEFIFLAGVVFVMSQIFKKGVEIQTENELTV